MSRLPLRAHTPNDEGKWHSLRDHLEGTARLASSFADQFGYGSSGGVLGLFHDLGKAHPAFQKFLIASFEGHQSDKCPHAIWGAAWLYAVLRKQRAVSWREFALPIQAHHAGLRGLDEAEGKLSAHFNEHRSSQIWREITSLGATLAQSLPRLSPQNDLCRREMLTRMLFSSLVDADRLDTESHFSPANAAVRGNWTQLSALWPIFRTNHLRLMWNGRGTAMSRIRASVYFDAKRSAGAEPGIFRLTVPTGGGKTRAAIAFALKHVISNPTHRFRRIIVALPYTSIVEQTSTEYRSIFGEPNVLEHHSQFVENGDAENDVEALKRTLASENWDYPVVVTTTVQLFESLFSNRTSQCRKLHRIAKSILVLDEVQTLPPELLRPTLDALTTLAEDYGVTVVLCTATQPTFEMTPYLPEWKSRTPVEIVPHHARLFAALDRVTYRRSEPVTDETLAGVLAGEVQVLAIFNTRKDALRVYERLLSQEVSGLYHLSTLLCGDHRRAVLREVRERLRNRKAVRLISTQVVEAGVDFDFPCVYRAFGPLDRVVQAAGRCNREFTLGRKGGRVVIFELIGGSQPKGPYASGTIIASQLLAEGGAEDRLSGTEIFQEYFRRLFRDVNTDKRNIQRLRREMDYSEVAKRYWLIGPTEQFVIASKDYAAIVDPLIKKHKYAPSRQSWRALQPYTVSLVEWEAVRLREGNAEEITNGLWRWNGPYDRTFHRGLRAEYDPADLIIDHP